MKYRLKRSYTVLIGASAALVIFLAAFIISGDSSEKSLATDIILFFLLTGVIIYEAGRIRGDRFFFDEDSFSIGEQKYCFSDIDYLQVDASGSRYIHTENIDVYVSGECVLSFNKRYKNADKFLQYAENYQVKIKVGLQAE